MILVYKESGLFLWGLNHRLGSVQRDLEQLRAAGLLAGPIRTLADLGYRRNFTLGSGETLRTLASGPLRQVLSLCQNPLALIYQHSFADSAVLPPAADDVDVMSRTRYFPPVLMQECGLDEIPYYCLFGTGCAGFPFLASAAAGLILASGDRPVLCLSADVKPSGAAGYDAPKERILASDCSSGFVVGRHPCGYRFLGVEQYSTRRAQLPLVELVKRTVSMIRELARTLEIELFAADVALHYPNVFPQVWQMVTQQLRLPRHRHVAPGLPDRGHCSSSDSVISLEEQHRGQLGKLHVVVTYGSGLHLGICMLSEEREKSPLG